MKKRYAKIILAITLVLLFAISLVGCGSQKESAKPTAAPSKIIFKVAHVTAPDTSKGVISELFKKLVEERSNGRIEVQVFHSSQLYGDKDEMQALMANNCQMIIPSITKLVSIDPSFQVVDLPFLFTTEEQAYKFMSGEGGKKLLDRLPKHGIQGLAVWHCSFIDVIGNKLFKTPADFKGVKIRMPAGQVTGDVLTALGSGASTVAFSEVYTSLQQRLVDGALTNTINFNAEKLYEVGKFITLLNVGYLEYIPMMNKKYYDGLPEDLREIITKTAIECADHHRKEVARQSEEVIKTMKAAGTEIYSLTPEEKATLKKLMDPVYAKWTPIIGKDLIDLAESLK